VIASSTFIQCNGSIEGRGSFVNNSTLSGAGGAIRLVANSISGNCSLNASGSSNNVGMVRIEAQSGQLSFTGSSIPSALVTLLNPVIIPTSATASLVVASIGGFPVLSDAGVRPGTVDVVLPRALSDPIAVAVQARNIPVGTQVNLNLSGSPGVTYTPGTLAGSLDISTATVLVSGLNRSGETHLFLFATFDVPQTVALFNPAGPDHVERVRLQAAPGQPSTMAFLRKDGSEIDLKKIPTRLLSYFGYANR